MGTRAHWGPVGKADIDYNVNVLICSAENLEDLNSVLKDLIQGSSLQPSGLDWLLHFQSSPR